MKEGGDKGVSCIRSYFACTSRKKKKKKCCFVQFIPLGQKSEKYGAKYGDGTEKLAGIFRPLFTYGNSGKHKSRSSRLAARVYELGK